MSVRGVLARHGYALAVLALTVAACISGWFFVVTVVVPEMERTSEVGAPAGTSFLLVAPSASPEASAAVLMNGAAIPASSECAGCHLTDRGVIGLRPIPALAHPLEGWTKCTACHATASLVSTAPGHSGIHATECLTCHQTADLPPPLSRPHRDRQNTACLDCHGSKAPLPADMTHRTDRVCWLCHRLPDVQPPVPAHETASGETDCLGCHVAGKVGALPADHLRRTASECLLCHVAPLGGASPGPRVTLSPSG